MSVLEPRVTSNARLRISIFSNPSYFCMCNFVSGNKAQLALFPATKLHIQKCNTCRDIENPSRGIILHNGTVRMSASNNEYELVLSLRAYVHLDACDVQRSAIVMTSARTSASHARTRAVYDAPSHVRALFSLFHTGCFDSSCVPHARSM